MILTILKLSIYLVCGAPFLYGLPSTLSYVPERNTTDIFNATETLFDSVMSGENHPGLKTIVKRSISMDDYSHNLNYAQAYVDHAQRHGGIEIADTVEIRKFSFPFIIAARIGEYTFSCRQDNGLLVINQRLSDGSFRNRQINGEFSFHPVVGIWWFVKCVGFETGGYGLDMKGVFKPGQDSGIDPNALKSLVG